MFKWIVSLIVWGVWRMDQGHAADLTGEGVVITGPTSGPDSGTGGGFTLDYLYGSGVPDRIEFTAALPTTSWLWLYTATGGVIQPQMWLDDTNMLTLYDRSGTPAPGIQLNPTGTSIFTKSLTVNGTDNRLPNQTLADPSSILTENLADGRYLRTGSTGISIGSVLAYGTTSGPTIALPGGSVTGAYSFAGINANASGYASTANGAYSTASGRLSNASGAYSTASADYSNASGAYSYASGYGSTASGYDSQAVGYGSSASGFECQAIGDGSTASGYHSYAVGYGSYASGSGCYASGYSQFVVGQYNAHQGNPTSWVATDDLFQIGNGSDWSHSSNAFTVQKNGNATVSGTLSATALNATTLVVTHVVPQGDLSMGSFTQGQ